MPSKITGVLIAAVCLVACSPSESPPAPSAATEPARPAEPAPPAAGGDWTTLLDGTSLGGWNRVGDANWQVQDGAVRADSGSGFLVSVTEYDDFDLEVQFSVSADANSGVFVRCQNPAEISQSNCYEINIFDQRPDPAYRTGAIVEVASPAVQIDAGGRDNVYRISARGPRLTVVLNGETTVDVEDDRFTSGPIALQRGAGDVSFRTVRIRTE